MLVLYMGQTDMLVKRLMSQCVPNRLSFKLDFSLESRWQCTLLYHLMMMVRLLTKAVWTDLQYSSINFIFMRADLLAVLWYSN